MKLCSASVRCVGSATERRASSLDGGAPIESSQAKQQAKLSAPVTARRAEKHA